MRSLDDPKALDQLGSRLGALQAETPRRWGTMTAGEMLCHVGDASASVLGRPGGGPSQSRPVRKWLALYTALPWPHDLKTPPSVDPRLGGTRPDDFERDRRRAVEGLRALAQAPAAAFPSAHGQFGAMSRADWLRWGYKHTDHHLRQFGV